jgi:small subunit ribosomal protein S1
MEQVAFMEPNNELIEQVGLEHNEPQTEEEDAAGEGDHLSMEELLDLENSRLELPQEGQVRSGVVVSVTENEVLVSIGAKSEGIIPSRELSQLSTEDRERMQVGEKIEVYVVSAEDTHGNLLLSYTRAIEESDWQKAETMEKSRELFEGQVSGYNKGGLIVPFGRLRGFVPASQISPSRRVMAGGGPPEQRWGKMIGDTVIARVIEVDRDRRRLIFSELEALQEAREIYKERLLEKINEGDVLKGRVTSLANFGAFVNINGADGLVHLTEISWERIKHPSEVLKVGQEVQVKVINIDRERKRIGLSIRQLLPDPWPEKVAHLKEGQLVEGKVVRLTKFGAFARLGEDLEGLIHISELSEKRVEHPKEVVKEGEVVTLRIIKIDIPRRRIGLSIRKVHSHAYADLDMLMAMEEMGVSEAVAEEEVPVEVGETGSDSLTPPENPTAPEVKEDTAEEAAVVETELESSVEES